MLTSLLSVTSAASDLTFLTIAELRAAVLLDNNSRDADLIRIGGRVADAIVQACSVATDGAVPPTLREEALTETFRFNRWFGYRLHAGGPHEMLYLARRPITSVTSVVEAGVDLDDTMYEVRPGVGALLRLNDDEPTRWAHDKIVISYVAGFASVPEGLKRAAEKLVRLYWSEASRDPSIKQETVPGVMQVTYGIGAPADPSIPRDIMDDLGPYINPLT